MKLVEKRDYIHSRLHQLDETTINELYERLRKREVLKEKLSSRARKSEENIRQEKVMTRSDIEERLKNSVEE